VTIPSPKSEAQALVCLLVRGAPGECYYNTLLCYDYFLIVHCGIARFLCGMRVYNYIRSSGIILIPIGYPGAKFRFFRVLRCWASPWRKIAYSVTHSLTQLFWCPGNRSACASKNKILFEFEIISLNVI